jgi:hypothetical protein
MEGRRALTFLLFRALATARKLLSMQLFLLALSIYQPNMKDKSSAPS